MVKHRRQCVAETTVEVEINFEVAATDGVEHQAVAAAFHPQTSAMRQLALLGFARVIQHAAGGLYRQQQMRAAEAL